MAHYPIQNERIYLCNLTSDFSLPTIVSESSPFAHMGVTLLTDFSFLALFLIVRSRLRPGEQVGQRRTLLIPQFRMRQGLTR